MTAPLTDDDIARIEALCGIAYAPEQGDGPQAFADRMSRATDRKEIVAAVPTLIAALREARAELDRLRAEAGAIRSALEARDFCCRNAEHGAEGWCDDCKDSDGRALTKAALSGTATVAYAARVAALEDVAESARADGHDGSDADHSLVACVICQSIAALAALDKPKETR